ncbi:hypothetical protein Q4491_18090 [Photobacterium sp. 2_MG-2023]|uniref:hypothetical protein n=1 Tax=Photobacterium sp. 2_MG-2023 TaxID=3062663 RepID=UPI0026E1887B|nr:hypothetical protein [Photobacterium sp. 2_MG-2023]MDO6583256.1 hypothetical protein [Photobacterium sp. 2_MG-2023]
MKKKRIIVVGLSGTAVLMFAIYSIWPTQHTDTESVQVAARETVSTSNKAALVATQPAIVTPHLSVSDDRKTAPGQKEITLPVDMADQFVVISSVYAAELAYPSYSRPLSVQDTQWLEPNRFVAVQAPVMDGNHTASLFLDSFRHFYPDPVSLTVQSSLPVESISVELIDVNTHQKLAAEQSLGNQVFFESDESWPSEIRARANIYFTTGSDILTADFRYYIPVAEVVAVAKPVSERADMSIPVTLSVKRDGIYRVRANLYTQSGKPVAVLSARQSLFAGEQTVTLKAHNSVLSDTDDYELRTFQVEKMSGFPGEETEYGISQKPVWPLGTIDVSLLSDEPYTPTPEEQQRMQFLQSAASD